MNAPHETTPEPVEVRGRYTLYSDGVWRDYDGAYIATEPESTDRLYGPRNDH